MIIQAGTRLLLLVAFISRFFLPNGLFRAI